MTEIEVTTTLEITYSAILTDTYSGIAMNDEEIDESVEKHIQEWCMINEIDRDAVKIINKDIDRR